MRKELEKLERQAEKMKDALTRRYNTKGERLLSYEDGFGWCEVRKRVSFVGKTSDLKFLGIRGCQRRGCSNHTPGKDGWSPYQPQDIVYEEENKRGVCLVLIRQRMSARKQVQFVSQEVD